MSLVTQSPSKSACAVGNVIRKKRRALDARPGQDKFKAAICDERATSCKPKTTTAAEKVMSYPMPCYVIPCHAMPRHAMPCHPMQCHAMPCHAPPCYVMSCYAMLRHSRFLQPLRLKQCLTEFSEFNEQTSSNTVYLLWICHSSLVGVATLFRSRLNLPLRRRLLRSLVPTQKNPSTQTQLPLLGVGFCPFTLLRRSRGACKEVLVVSLTYWQTKSAVQVGHCRRI